MRGLTPAQITAIRNSPHTVAGVRIGPDDNDIVLINTSDRDITHDGKTYLARSNIISLGRFSESQELNSPTTEVVFGASNRAVANRFDSAGAVGWGIDIIQFWLDNDWSVVADTIIWSGTVTGSVVGQEGSSATITINASTRFQNYREIEGRKATRGSQQQHFPNDLGFSETHAADRELRWGGE